jgi:hypothetical protein
MKPIGANERPAAEHYPLQALLTTSLPPCQQFLLSLAAPLYA